MVFVHTVSFWRGGARLLGLILLIAGFAPAQAFADPAWVLDPSASSLSYQSIKKNSIVETNSIRNITGRIEPDGAASVAFDLNSVDTGVDLRNVRMRFLFFETFKYPTAVLTAKVDPADFADLPIRRRVIVPLSFRLSLHGVEKAMTSDVVVTLITDGMVSVASKSPIAVHVEDFGLLPAIEKLEQAANVTEHRPHRVRVVRFRLQQGGRGRCAGRRRRMPKPPFRPRSRPPPPRKRPPHRSRRPR